MNDKQLRVRAETECSFLFDDEFTKIRVAAQSDNEIATTCVTILNDWSKKGCGKVKIKRTGSLGYKDLEPIVIVEKPSIPPILYPHITEDTLSQLIQSYLEGDDPRTDLALCAIGSERVQGIPAEVELPLFQLQKRIVLRNCGIVDPENLCEYIAGCEGYSGLAKALQMSPMDIVEEIRRSGLRERTGHGCLTATQWMGFLEDETSEKVVICNALDTDLQARTARLLLEGDPHSILEGLLIASYAVGASQCIVTIPTGFEKVKDKLVNAIAQMKKTSLLGQTILDTEFNCDIEIKEVPSSIVAGEKTALLRFLEGKQAIPFLQNKDKKPELNSNQVLINNIETLANVSAILQKGADWFAKIGTVGSTGTKIITLTGAVVHSYTVEVPFGTTIDTVIQEIGGGICGISNGTAIKAVQFGGPTSAYFDADDITKEIDYETVKTTGSLMGFGTIEVVADDTCAVEITEQLMELLHSQSCGKCVYCREGTLHMSHILKDIAKGEGTVKDLDLLKELGEKMLVGSICSFGLSAANPVLSSIRLFQPDYDFHIKQKKCPKRQSGKEE